MSAASQRAGLLPGFADPVFDSQAVFRGLMEAISYPGRTIRLDRPLAVPPPLDPATAMICLALIDFETPLWLDDRASAGDVPGYLRFHAGVPIVSQPAAARFAVITDPARLPPISGFALGDDQYPDRSATLIVQVTGLGHGPVTRWRGPGIQHHAEVAIAGLPATFWDEWALNGGLYPRGVDVFFVAGGAVIGLPRGISVEA